MESSERSLTAFKANLAEQAERYEEMVEAMKKLVMGVKDPLTKIERNLLSVAYKNVIGSKRSSLRVLITMEDKAKSKGESSNQDKAVLAEMKEQVQKEIGDVCDDILQLLQSHLLPNLPDNKEQETQEEYVFYHKMEGDYHRYLAEYTTGEMRSTHAQNGLMAYKKAADIAKKDLVATNPIRLGLALNFSVFYYEILDKPDKACAVAKEAFDEALPELENVPDETYKDSTLIMQLLRDNLTLWTSDAEGKEEDLAAEDIEQS